jgi:hypothetical protein
LNDVVALLGTIPTWAALTITSLTALSSALRLLQGNAMILRLFVRKFDLWLAFAYAVFAAASGCVALPLQSRPSRAVVRLSDATPDHAALRLAARRVRCRGPGTPTRLLPSYSVFCAVCTGLPTPHRFGRSACFASLRARHRAAFLRTWCSSRSRCATCTAASALILQERRAGCCRWLTQDATGDERRAPAASGGLVGGPAHHGVALQRDRHDRTIVPSQDLTQRVVGARERVDASHGP